MSTLKVDTILKRTGTGTITLGQSGDTISIPSGATLSNQGTTVPTAFGKIGQVKSVNLSTATTYNNSSFTDIAGLSLAITPSATTSKILIMSSLSYSYDDSAQNRIYFQILRDSTSIMITSGAFDTAVDSAHLSTTTPIFLDSPNTTSAVTYKIQGKSTNSALDIRISGNSDSTQTTSTLTLFEVLE